MDEKLKPHWDMISGTHKLRDQVLSALSDKDLSLKLGGDTLSFGELIREMGEVEHAYLSSFETFTQDFSFRNEAAGLTGSRERLSGWLTELDATFQATLDRLSDADAARPIQRGFEVTPDIQLQIYLQALLIFLGKASVYLRSLGKPLSDDMRSWIG